MNQSVDPHDIPWKDNDSKRLSDQAAYSNMASDLFRQAEKRGKKPLRVLSFPGAKWLWEQALEESFRKLKFRFTGLERDERVWRKASKMADVLPSRFNLRPRAESFVDYSKSISTKRTRFDLIYLDWMGTWSAEKKSDIDALLSRGCMLEVGGILMLTVSLRRGQPATIEDLEDESNDLSMAFYYAPGRDKSERNLKARGIPGWVQHLAEEDYSMRLRPIMGNVFYSCEGGGSQCEPQLQLMFLREE